MPFTPHHFGPGLFLGIPLRGYIHAPTFITANVILDAEPFLVMTLGLNYPLHDYLHSFVAAAGIGLVLALAMYIIEARISPFYKMLFLETDRHMEKSKFMVAGVLGTSLHVLFDAPLYGDIKPLYPLAANPFLGFASSSTVYDMCLWMGIVGLALLLSFLVLRVFKRANFHRPKLTQVENNLNLKQT